MVSECFMTKTPKITSKYSIFGNSSITELLLSFIPYSKHTNTISLYLPFSFSYLFKKFSILKLLSSILFFKTPFFHPKLCYSYLHFYPIFISIFYLHSFIFFLQKLEFSIFPYLVNTKQNSVNSSKSMTLQTCYNTPTPDFHWAVSQK